MNPLIMALLSRLPQMGAAASKFTKLPQLGAAMSRGADAFANAPKWKQFATLSPLALMPTMARGSGEDSNIPVSESARIRQELVDAGITTPDLPPNPLFPKDRMLDPNIRFGDPSSLERRLDLARVPIDLTRVPTPAESTSASGSELPFETYQRLTGQKWTGGSSDPVRALLQELGVSAQPGSSEANMGLQKALMARSATPTAPVSAQAHPALADLFQSPKASMPDLESITSDSLPAEALMNLPGTTQGMAIPEQVRRRFLGLF